MSSSSGKLAALTLLVTFLAMTRNAASFPWSIDMFRNPPIQPLAVAPRAMPPGTLPLNGAEPMGREQASTELRNPFQPTKERIDRGQKLYSNLCQPCHGKEGKGDGPVASFLKKRPLDLHSEEALSYTDGYIYATIRDGTKSMAAYADAMSADERWDVVMFVRSMQGRLATK